EKFTSGGTEELLLVSKTWKEKSTYSPFLPRSSKHLCGFWCAKCHFLVVYLIWVLSPWQLTIPKISLFSHGYLRSLHSRPTVRRLFSDSSHLKVTRCCTPR